MTANTPPKPHAEGDRFTNAETGITYEFKSGAWRAVSSEAADAVVDAISELNLEKVLTAGNVADKDIVLTDGVDDLIDISPTEGRIVIASDADTKTPKITLAHFGDIDEGNRKAEIELDENGTRLDFEMSGDVKDVHFRFGDDEKFIINHEGDAEFVGKVKVEPGTEDNEVVTYGQLVTVAEELEQLAPSFERGKYNYSADEVTASSASNGNYNLIRKNTTSDGSAERAACLDAKNLCNRIPDNDSIDCENTYQACLANIPAAGTIDVYINKFADVQQIKFSKVDDDGVNHEWSDVAVGQQIDVFNESNSDFMVAEITAKEGTNVITLTVDVLQSKGNATGAARIKVFTLNDEVGDLTNYVRKTGDTMSGELTIDSGKELALYIKGNADSNATLFYARGLADTTLFRINCNGQVQAGNDAANAFMATSDNDVTTKKWVESNTVKAGSSGIRIDISDSGVYYITGGL